MASLGGSVGFARMKQQLRQLFHHPNSATKEDIFSVTEEKSVSRGKDLSYEAWVAYRNKQKQPTVAGAAFRPSSKSGRGKNSKSPRGVQEKMALIAAPGNETVVMAVEVNIIFYPNAQPSRNERHRLRRLLPLRIPDRPFLPSPWRTHRRMLTRRSIRLPPP